MPDPDEQHAISARRRHCREVFEREVEKLLDRLYGTALRLTRNPDDAEDVVAETIGKAWAKIDQLDDLQCLERWLFRILNNTFINLWRQKQRRESVESEPFVEDDDSGVDSFSLFRALHQPFLLWWSSPELAFLNNVLREDLQRALDALPDAYRVVMVLVEVQGYTYEEVAQLLDIPLGTVRSRLNRSRGMLQKALWRQAQDAGLAHAGDRNDGGNAE